MLLKKKEKEKKNNVYYSKSLSAVRATVLPDIAVPSCSFGRSSVRCKFKN